MSTEWHRLCWYILWNYDQVFGSVLLLLSPFGTVRDTATRIFNWFIYTLNFTHLYTMSVVVGVCIIYPTYSCLFLWTFSTCNFPSLKCTFLLLVRIFLSCCSFYFVDIQLFPVYVFLISLSNLIITNFGFISYYFLWCLFLYI